VTDSSTEAAPAPVTATEAKDVASPAPSTGETKGVETSYLDRVTAALGEGKAESPAATDGKETKPPPVATGDVKKADELGPDDDTGTYPRTAQGRIRHLADQVKTTKAENARLAESAKLSDQLVDFMEEKGIAPEELDNILKLTALIQGNDNEGALKVLAPIYRQLLDRTGNILPADLEQQVKQGKMTRDTALELNRARAKAKDLETQRSTTAKRTEAATREAAWNQAKALSDPDWHQKQPLVAKELKLLVQERVLQKGPAGYPTAKETVALAEQALKSVEDHLKQFRPAPQQRTVPQGDSTSPRSKAKPTSYMDAINQALAA
jgi:hypothetical protein